MPLKTFSGFIWKHVFNNFTAKVMAMAMALGLWLFAYIRSTTEYADFEIPVHVHAAKGWSVVRGENLLVKVRLSYPRRFEDKFNQELKPGGKTYIDCDVAPTLDQKPVTMPLKPDLLTTAREFSLQIEYFKPSELHIAFTDDPHADIELIREASGMVPVLPKTSAPPPGYEVDVFALTPEVMIHGPEDVVAQLTKSGIETEKINISSPPPGYLMEWEVPARIPSSVTIGGKSYPIFCADPVVPCHVHLTRKLVERNFAAVPIMLLVPPNYPYVATLLRESTTNVQVTGPSAVVDALKKENIVLYVDVRDTKVLVPQETPYTQPLYAQIVDEHQRPMIIADLVVKPAVTDWAVKISDAKPK